MVCHIFNFIEFHFNTVMDHNKVCYPQASGWIWNRVVSRQVKIKSKGYVLITHCEQGIIPHAEGGEDG